MICINLQVNLKNCNNSQFTLFLRITQTSQFATVCAGEWLIKLERYLIDSFKSTKWWIYAPNIFAFEETCWVSESHPHYFSDLLKRDWNHSYYSQEPYLENFQNTSLHSKQEKWSGSSSRQICKPSITANFPGTLRNTQSSQFATVWIGQWLMTFEGMLIDFLFHWHDKYMIRACLQSGKHNKSHNRISNTSDAGTSPSGSIPSLFRILIRSHFKK